MGGARVTSSGRDLRDIIHVLVESMSYHGQASGRRDQGESRRFRDLPQAEEVREVFEYSTVDSTDW